MPDTLMELAVLCPWCGQGETLADQSADIRVSCQCIFCKRFYKIDFRTMRVLKTKAKPRKLIKQVTK
jgi:ribosomal protein S27AE